VAIPAMSQFEEIGLDILADVILAVIAVLIFFLELLLEGYYMRYFRQLLAYFEGILI
jgi:hypothetical protein